MTITLIYQIPGGELRAAGNELDVTDTLIHELSIQQELGYSDPGRPPNRDLSFSRAMVRQ